MSACPHEADMPCGCWEWEAVVDRAGRQPPGLSAPPLTADCETLIRRMLAVDPAKRISIAQIRQHRWVRAGPTPPQPACPAFSTLSYSSNLGDYDEQVLGIMQTLGVDRQRTVEVSIHLTCTLGGYTSHAL